MPEIGLEGDPLDRRFRMELEWKPRQLNETLLLQLFDSDRVDVAPGSNVVREDDQLDGLGEFSHLLNSKLETAMHDSRAHAF